MSKEPKKKPGDMAKARQLHLQNQARRDALAKLRNGESIDIWAHLELGSARITVKPYTPKQGDQVLCLFSKRLRVMTCSEKRGNHWLLTDKSNRTGVVPSDQVFGVVTEIFEMKPSQE